MYYYGINRVVMDLFIVIFCMKAAFQLVHTITIISNFTSYYLVVCFVYRKMEKMWKVAMRSQCQKC